MLGSLLHIKLNYLNLKSNCYQINVVELESKIFPTRRSGVKVWSIMKWKYLSKVQAHQIVQYSTWVNVLSYIPSLLLLFRLQNIMSLILSKEGTNKYRRSRVMNSVELSAPLLPPISPVMLTVYSWPAARPVWVKVVRLPSTCTFICWSLSFCLGQTQRKNNESQ